MVQQLGQVTPECTFLAADGLAFVEDFFRFFEAASPALECSRIRFDWLKGLGRRLPDTTSIELRSSIELVLEMRDKAFVWNDGHFDNEVDSPGSQCSEGPQNVVYLLPKELVEKLAEWYGAPLNVSAQIMQFFQVSRLKDLSKVSTTVIA